jgi:hypothetical protein
MEQKKKRWQKPKLEQLKVEEPIQCNPAWPQWSVCDSSGVPQNQTTCNMKPSTFS